MRTNDDKNIFESYNNEVVEEGVFSRMAAGSPIVKKLSQYGRNIKAGGSALASGASSVIPRAKGLVTGGKTTGIRDAMRQGYDQSVQNDLSKNIENFKNNISDCIAELKNDMSDLGYDAEKYPEITTALKQLMSDLEMPSTDIKRGRETYK